MSWFADLAGKAENLLNNLDEQTGAALRNHNVSNHKKNGHDILHSDPIWGQKKRPIPRNLKKNSPVDTRANYSPSRKPSPSQTKDSLDISKERPVRNKSPKRRANPMYTLNNCPNTLVCDIDQNDIVADQYGLKQRRFSLPEDLELVSNDNWTYKIQNLEVENVMLKNELNVMNREVSELLERLRKTEDGNDVVGSFQELSKTNTKLENSETINHQVHLERESFTSQLEQLKNRIDNITAVEISNYKDQNNRLENEVTLLKDRNNVLEERVRELIDKQTEKDSIQVKLENELRHAQSTIGDLQNNLERSNAECGRLEKDWETYKLRVKSMLSAKDNEIKSLQEGLNITEDTKKLMEQIESLKEEREELSDSISVVRAECADMKQYVEQLEARHEMGERAVAVLRDALREERSARNKAETHCIVLEKELKSLQMEMGQTIASLRTALHDKDSELNQLRETTSCSVRTTDTSALNVADYDVMQDRIDHDKIQYLTQTLVQKQQKIDALLADNNMLKIQLDKLQCKYKSEMASLRAHSVVNVQEEGRVRRAHRAAGSTLAAVSVRLGLTLRRYPALRIFIILYMIGLHLWVLTVLLTSTPEDYLHRPAKS